MDFLRIVLEQIPNAAAHPFAFISYLSAIAAWVILGFRISRNKHLIDGIEKLPEKDRLAALQSEMGQIRVRGGFSATEWLRLKRQQYLFLGIMFVLFAGLVVFVIAISNSSKLVASKEELSDLMLTRTQKTEKLFSELSLDIKELIPIHARFATLSKERQSALDEGKLIVAHELGNEINALSSNVDPLLKKFSAKFVELEKLMTSLNALCAHCGPPTAIKFTHEMENVRKLEGLVQSLDSHCRQTDNISSLIKGGAHSSTCY